MIKTLFKSKPITAAIDISNGWIKIAQAEQKAGDISVLDVSAVQFPAYSQEKEVQQDHAFPRRGVLPQSFSMSGQTISRKEFSRIVWGILKGRPQTIIGCIPRQSAMIRFIKLPSANNEEIESMLEFQVTRQLPFSKEDIVTGYKILEVDQEGYSKVLLVVVQENILSNYFDLLKLAGLPPTSICLSSEAVLNWFLNDKAGSRMSGQGMYILIDVDYLFTELLICEGGNILFSRAFVQGASSLCNFEKELEITTWARTLADNIRHSLLAFKKEKAVDSELINNIVITGGVYKFFKYIKEDLQKELEVNVEYVDVLDSIKIQTTDQDWADYRSLPVSFSTIGGMALYGESLIIDLLPKELKAQRLHRQKKMEITRLYILFSSIFACLFLLLSVKFYFNESNLSYLDRRLAQIRPYVKDAELMNEKLEVAKKQADTSNSPLEILKEIYNTIPQDMNLYGFSVKDGNQVLLRGTSQAMSRVFDVVSILENSKHFKNIKVAFANKRKIENEELVDFQINCLLK